MGFPVSQAEYLLPKFLVRMADFISQILRLIAWFFSSVGLSDLLLNSTSTTATFQTTFSSSTSPNSKSRQAFLLNAIPAEKYEDSHVDGVTNGGTCAVCIQEFAAREDVRKLSNCRHVFHKCCIDPWVELGRTTCPLCRTPFVLEDTKDYVDGSSSVMSLPPTISYYYYDEDYDGDSHYGL